MKDTTYKVGDVARMAGITVRTLHHYEKFGLLPSPARSPKGHRLFTDQDLLRLFQILSLVGQGYSLTEIKRQLEGQLPSAVEMVRKHKAAIQRQKEKAAKLLSGLESIETAFSRKGDFPREELISAMRLMSQESNGSFDSPHKW